MTVADLNTPAMPDAVANVFACYAPAARKTLMAVRQLIYATAAVAEVGPLTETLKWAEPAFLPAKARTGTTVRLGWKPPSPERCAVLFHCQTTLIDDFRGQFAKELRFEGNRAIVLDAGRPLPEAPLAACLAMALTYHHHKRRGR